MAFIQSLLEPYVECALECDGLSRVFHYVLSEHQIPHTMMVGSLTGIGGKIGYHVWIILDGELPGDERIIDYRARMWLGESAPHGVFSQASYPDYHYNGEILEEEPISNQIFQILISM